MKYAITYNSAQRQVACSRFYHCAIAKLPQWDQNGYWSSRNCSTMQSRVTVRVSISWAH